MENQEPSLHDKSQTTFSPTSKALASALTSTLTQLKPQGNSLITGKASASLCPTGKPFSEIALGELRNIGQNVQTGNLLDDRALWTLLVQHFGLSRIVKREKFNSEFDVVGYEIGFSGVGPGEQTALDAMIFFNKPAPTKFVAGKIAKLRAAMAHKATSNEDLTLQIEAYVEHLVEYPPDAVAFVVDKTIAEKKWFPLVSELRDELDKIMLFRKALLDAFMNPNPALLVQEKQKQIASDPRLRMHWKDLSRRDWLPQHWEEYIADAEKMVGLAKQNPHVFKEEEWSSVVARRQHEHFEFLRGKSL